MLGAAEIRAGDAEIVVAGGMENMNQGPYLIPKARFGYRLGNAEMIDATVHDGLWCSIEGCHMGTHAERVAIKNQVSRAPTRTSSRSRATRRRSPRSTRAASATRSCRCPCGAARRSHASTPTRGPRADTSLEALARLKPVFALPDPSRIDRGGMPDGTVTAGNAPGITDGAAATVVASERAVERLGLKPLARIVGYARPRSRPSGSSWRRSRACRSCWPRSRCRSRRFDLVEINEAFAAQVLADGRELGFDWSKVNVNGGAIALGHPIGASGARIVATLLHELRQERGHAMDWRRCAWAAADRWRWPSSASSERQTHR